LTMPLCFLFSFFRSIFNCLLDFFIFTPQRKKEGPGSDNRSGAFPYYDNPHQS
jgi:hypothetical protein